MKRRSTLKKHSKSLQRSEPSLKRTKARGPVQRDAKEVLAEVLGKLTGKLDAPAVSTSAKENRRGNTVGPNRDRLTVGVDLQSLYPIRHRSREVRQDLVVLRARDALVSVRTELINTTRGLVKSMGTRLPRCSSPSFAEKVKDAIPVEVREALLPLVQLTETVNDCIARYDQKIEELGQKKYGHTTLLRQVKGVGPITSLA